jgi:hypothetical protein
MTLVKSGSRSAADETADLGFLAYLLAMVEQEAEGAAGPLKDKPGNT